MVKISWTDPDSNSGTINGYKVYIADSSGTYQEEVTYCYGMIDPVLTNKYCEVPMSVLRTTYGLAYNTLVTAKV